MELPAAYSQLKRLSAGKRMKSAEKSLRQEEIPKVEQFVHPVGGNKRGNYASCESEGHN